MRSPARLSGELGFYPLHNCVLKCNILSSSFNISEKTKGGYVINVNSATTAKYIYIANTDVENEASYKLSLLDHSVSYHEVHNSSYTKNGVAGSKVAENDYVIEGDYYSSPDSQAYQNFLNGDYEKLKAPSAKYYEENSTGKEVLKHTVSAKSGLYSPYNY